MNVEQEHFFSIASDCIGDSDQLSTQCCLCCTDLSSELSLPNDSTDYCQIGCLGYLNITCDVIDNSEDPSNEEKMEYCSYGESFGGEENIFVNGMEASCSSEGQIETTRVVNTRAPTESSTIELPNSDGISKELGAAFIIGALLIALFVVTLLTITYWFSKKMNDVTRDLKRVISAAELNNEEISTEIISNVRSFNIDSEI